MTISINIIFILNKILKLPENQNKQGRRGVKTTVVINILMCTIENNTFSFYFYLNRKVGDKKVY